MEDGGCRRWQDDVEPDLRPRMVQQIMDMLARNLKTFPNERLQQYVAKVEMDTFMAANSKMEYMRMMSSHATRFQKLAQPHKAAAHRQQEMHMGHPVQLDNTMQATQGGNSSFAAIIPQTAPMMANPAGSPFQLQNQHMASPFVPNMKVNANQIPSDMVGMLYRTFNPQPAMVVPLEQSVQSCQQDIQPIAMQSHSQRPAMQGQPTKITQFHQASMAQLEGHPIAWRNDGYNDHLHRQNDCAAQHLQPTVQQQHFGITQQHVGMQSYQVLGANVGKMNDGYSGGWNNHQNAGWASGIQSPEYEQVALKKQIDMESELMPPALRQITVNQQSNVHCPNPQYQARMGSDGEVDWREQMVQQIKSLKDAYFLELMEFDQTVVVHRLTEEQFKLLPREKADRYNLMLRTKSCLSAVLKFLQLEKSIDETYRGKLPKYEKIIGYLLSCHRKSKANAQMNTGQELMSCPRQHPPRTINLTAGISPFTGGKSDKQKLLADESIGQMTQNVVTTPSAGQKSCGNQSQGVTSIRFSIKSPGASQSSPINEVGLFCKQSPIDKLEVASPNALLKSRSQPSVAKPGVIEDLSRTVPLNSTLTSTVEKSEFLDADSSCASLKSASPSGIEKSGIIPVVSPSHRGSSLLHNNIEVNGCNQTTPTELLTPGPPCQTQTPAGQAEDQEHGGVQTPVAKKPIDRLIAAVRSSSPMVLCSSVNLMKSALREMDSVPLRTGSNNKIKRIYDVAPTSESPTVSSMDGSIVTFELDASDSASSRYGSVKRQKTQDTRVALLDEIEAVNNRLIDSEISITSDDREDGTTSCTGVTVVKLSYTAVSLAPSLKSQLATSGNLQPLMMPMTLLIPADYPRSSPVIMDDEGEAQLRTKFSCISVVVDSSFRLALRILKEPRSLKETAMVWDSCVRRAVMEYAYQLGGGTLTMSLGCREGWVAA